MGVVALCCLGVTALTDRCYQVDYLPALLTYAVDNQQEMNYSQHVIVVSHCYIKYSEVTFSSSPILQYDLHDYDLQEILKLQIFHVFRSRFSCNEH